VDALSVRSPVFGPTEGRSSRRHRQAAAFVPGAARRAVAHKNLIARRWPVIAPAYIIRPRILVAYIARCLLLALRGVMTQS